MKSITDTLNSTSIVSWSPARRFKAGIARTFQDIRLWSSLSAVENVEVSIVGASRHRSRQTALDALQRLGLSSLAAGAA